MPRRFGGGEMRKHRELEPILYKAMTSELLQNAANCGINPEDAESSRIQAAGLIIRDLPIRVSNFRSTQSLSDYLKSQSIPVGIYSTSYQFDKIAGTTTSTSAIAGLPSWLAGTSPSTAPAVPAASRRNARRCMPSLRARVRCGSA